MEELATYPGRDDQNVVSEEQRLAQRTHSWFEHLQRCGQVGRVFLSLFLQCIQPLDIKAHYGCPGRCSRWHKKVSRS